MKKRVNLISLCTIITMLLQLSCSPKDKKDEAAKMEMSDAKTTEPTQTEIMPFEGVDQSVKTQINGFLSDYLTLNQALIEDSQDGAKVAGKKLSETVNKFDMSKLAGEQMDFYHTQQAKLTKSLQGISESADIEETRLELAIISESMYALVKAYHPNESELYYQFCPMAKNGDGASWLSNTKEIINPYMGQRMLACGRTQETLN